MNGINTSELSEKIIRTMLIFSEKLTLENQIYVCGVIDGIALQQNKAN